MAEPRLPRPPVELLERAGLRRCSKRKCKVWIDPANVDGERCKRHQGKCDR